MKISKIMTERVGACAPQDLVSKAVQIMWERDCGSVPVVSDGKPVGMITDRDVAIALATRNQMANEIQAGELMGGQLVTCTIKDSVKKVLKKMEKNRVRRIPVIGNKGKLVGIVTIADILRVSNSDSKLAKSAIKTLTSITRPRSKTATAG